MRMKTVTQQKTPKPVFPKIRHDLLDRLSDKADQLAGPTRAAAPASDDQGRWAA